jgi:beta-N-acetylhexosaminidase
MTREDLGKKPFYLTEDQSDWVMETCAAMTERQKIGQLFCVNATSFSEEELEILVRDYAVGGVLYRPVFTKEQLLEKFRKLDSAAAFPLLKTANLEEGGNGAYSGGTRFATQLGVAATGDLSDVTHFAKVCLKEGSEAGINWTFSPVADLDLNFMNPIINVRAFGSDQVYVQNAVNEYIRVVQDGGMAACAKHFPGDGVDFRDQHLHPTYNTLSAQEWYDSYGKIYESMIDQGLLSIMAGHIVQPEVEREINPGLTDAQLLPGSLSRELLTGVLRERFGFNGVIATDATIMGGYNMAMERERALPASIEAGCDMLVFNNHFYEDYQMMIDGLKKNYLSVERLDEAVMRILALKAKVAREQKDEVEELPVKEWVTACADRSVTLVKNTTGIVPVQKDKYTRVKLICFGEDKTPDGSLKAMVTEALEKEGLNVEEYIPTFKDDLKAVRELDSHTLTVYICNMEAKSNNTAVRIYWFPKHAMQIPRYIEAEDGIFLSFSNPYHLQDIPRIRTYINAYSASQATVDAVIGKMFGRSEFKGISPVDAFCGLMDTHL